MREIKKNNERKMRGENVRVLNVGDVNDFHPLSSGSSGLNVNNESTSFPVLESFCFLAYCFFLMGPWIFDCQDAQVVVQASRRK